MHGKDDRSNVIYWETRSEEGHVEDPGMGGRVILRDVYMVA